MRALFVLPALLCLETGCTLLVDQRLETHAPLDAGPDAGQGAPPGDTNTADGSTVSTHRDGQGGTAGDGGASDGKDPDGDGDGDGEDAVDTDAPGSDADRPGRGGDEEDAGAPPDPGEDGVEGDGADAGSQGPTDDAGSHEPSDAQMPEPAKPSRKDIQACAGLNHGCLLQPDGALQCFGSNAEGQATAPQGSFTAVSCGESHSCALHADSGHLTCWGSNAGGQRAERAARHLDVAAGRRHTCALDAEGQAECWGEDDLGQATPPDTRFVSLAAGHDFTCGIRAEDHGAECWGNNESLQARPPQGERFASLSLSGDYGCGVTESGVLHCWGHSYIADYDGARAEHVATNVALACSIQDEAVSCGEAEVPLFGGYWFFENTLSEGRWAKLFGGYRTLCGVPMEGPVICEEMGPNTSQPIDRGVTIRLPE